MPLAAQVHLPPRLPPRWKQELVPLAAQVLLLPRPLRPLTPVQVPLAAQYRQRPCPNQGQTPRIKMSVKLKLVPLAAQVLRKLRPRRRAPPRVIDDTEERKHNGVDGQVGFGPPLVGPGEPTRTRRIHVPFLILMAIENSPCFS